MSTPNVKDRDTTLNAVAAVGRSEVWAVGYSLDPQRTSKPFVIRWDGDTWRSVPAPSPSDGGMLTDVGAHQDGTVRAVGTNGAVTAGIILRWDGSAWIGVPSPVEGANFIGVSVFDPSDAFAYGNWSSFTKSLIEQAPPSTGSPRLASREGRV